MLKFTIFLLLVLSANLFAQDIPKSAVILEKKNVTTKRQLVLWMANATKHPRDADDEIYTCPDQTRGHYYSGIAFVSLFDTKSKKLINTLEIDLNEEINLDLPYLIHAGYYKVPTLNKRKEGKPVIMNLQDYNADGKSFEFAIFNAIACMGLETTLVGYSEKQDRLIQYPIELKTKDKTYNGFWADELFGNKPRSGVWKYQIDYRGRGGTLDKYAFRYDSVNEKFVGQLVSIADDEEIKDSKSK